MPGTEQTPPLPAPVARVLMVDDNAANLLALEAVLEHMLLPLGHRLVRASSGEEALKQLLDDEYALILMDVQMAGMDGLECATIIKQRERTRHVPIIFLTATQKAADRVFQAYSGGAVDYLLKPVDPYVLRTKVGVFVDLWVKSERLRREELRRERESQEKRSLARYHQLIDAMPLCLWSTDAAGRVVHMNESWITYAGGVTPARGGELWAGSHVHPEDRPAVEASWRSALAGGERFEIEARLRAADGGHRWHLVRGLPETGANTRGWIVTATDVDAQKRAQDALRYSASASHVLSSSLEIEVTLASLVQLVVPGLADWCAVDLRARDGVVRRAAGEAGQTCALALDVIERNEPVLVADVPSAAREVRGRGGEVGERGRRLVELAEGGCRSFLCVPLAARGRSFGALSAIARDARRPFDRADVEIALDLARRAGMAADNARLYQEAQRSIRMRDDFLAVASHELRTPLTSLQLLVQAFLRRVERGLDAPPVAVVERMHGIERQAQHLGRLVDNLLDASRIAAGDLPLTPTRVDLEEVVRAAIAARKEDLDGAGCEVDVQVAGADAVIGRWDRARVQQVVEALLSNAMKYGRGRPIEIAVGRGDERARLSVRDHGFGIDPGDQARVFERFERAVPTTHFGGLGVGLWIVQRIAAAMGGTVRVASVPGEGATFTVELPAWVEARAAGEEPR